MRIPRRTRAITAGLSAVALTALGATSAAASDGSTSARHHGASTATPIKHLVVIFDENISFDHYFGTYPYALNPPGEPAFHARPGTPTVNGLYNSVGPSGPTGPLLTSNPNQSNPLRLGPDDPMTCDQDHAYTAEQQRCRPRRRGHVPAEHRERRDPGQCLAGLQLPRQARAGTAGRGARTTPSWTTTTATP